MTNKIVCNAEDLTAIADAVRASNGSTNTYNVPELSAAAVNAIGNGGGAAVQADWAVNDEADPAFVKNRTHWKVSYPEISFNSDMEYTESFDATTAGMGTFVKVSQEYLPEEVVLRSKEVKTYLPSGELENAFVAAPEIILAESGVVLFRIYAGIYNEYMVSAPGEMDLTQSYGFSIPSKGVYWMWRDNTNSRTVAVSFEDTYHPFDAGFLPDTVITKEYVNTVLLLHPNSIDLVVDGDEYSDSFVVGEYLVQGDIPERLARGVAELLVTFDGGGHTAIRFLLQHEFSNGMRHGNTICTLLDGTLAIVHVEFNITDQTIPFKAWAKSLTL